jgi:hypothetical protein
MVISFVVPIQLLEESLIVEMNIEQDIAVRQFQCCGAAKLKMHGKINNRLTSRQGFSKRSPDRRIYNL